MPVPSSNSVTENVLLDPQPSPPNSGTLIHRTLNAFTFPNPSACTGKFLGLTALAFGFKSVHAGAILGGPALKSSTDATLLVSPTPNVMFPFEFKKNPFHTHPAVPTGPPNTNSNPPDNGPTNAGVPNPLSSSPRNGVF